MFRWRGSERKPLTHLATIVQAYIVRGELHVDNLLKTYMQTDGYAWRYSAGSSFHTDTNAILHYV